MKQVLFLSVLLITFYNHTVAQIKPTQLTCEYMDNPSVVDTPQPRLAWINLAENNERGQTQSAWQVRVASSKKQLNNPNLWDSKKMIGNESIRVKYKGIELGSRQDCWWQVRVWDKDGKISDWSEPAFWHMGLLDPTDWKAKWIGAPWQGEEMLPIPSDRSTHIPEQLPPPAPMFRKEFTAKKKIENAVVYVTGLGYFELFLNGNKVGDDVLVPNQTNYSKRPELPQRFIQLDDNFKEYRVMYLAYNVKEMLKQGANVIGSIIGNGFYNPSSPWTSGYGSPRFIAQLHITYTDGSKDVIISDKSWKVSKSPILMDMVYYGEHYDARLKQDGWSTAGFEDTKWKYAVIRKAPEGKLVAQTAHSDKVVEQIKPIRIEKNYEGNYIVDFGVEVSGWVKLSNMRAPAGHKIEIKYLSNNFSGDNSYVFRGKGMENYAARFNWFVFREVEIVNWRGVLRPEQITAEVVNTYVEKSAVFETSNTLFNQVNQIWQRSQTDNMHGGIASDCPHRERSAYTGDAQVSCVTVMHNFDAKSFYHKWIHDIIGAQNKETGYVPNAAPWQPGSGGGVAWGAAVCIIPWEFYRQYGAVDILEDAYPAMKDYIKYMQSWVDRDGIMFSKRKGVDGKILKWFNLGDWVAPGILPADDLVHTFYFWRCADFTAKTAVVLGKSEEAKKYTALANVTKQAFHKRFYNDQKGSYGVAGSNIFALKMGVPESQYKKVVDALKENINGNNGHLDTGIFGTQFFFEVLSENGLHDLAYEAMNKKEEPGYGRWLALGGTTTWEEWGTGGSHNHPMFGGGLVWYYRKLAGMDIDYREPAYRHIIFRPQLVEDLSFVKYQNNTSYGKAGILWKNNNDSFSMEIIVPVGCYATVYVPTDKNQNVFESGKKVINSNFVTTAGEKDGYKIFKVLSGEYKFEVK